MPSIPHSLFIRTWVFYICLNFCLRILWISNISRLYSNIPYNKYILIYDIGNCLEWELHQYFPNIIHSSWVVDHQCGVSSLNVARSQTKIEYLYTKSIVHILIFLHTIHLSKVTIKMATLFSELVALIYSTNWLDKTKCSFIR